MDELPDDYNPLDNKTIVFRGQFLTHMVEMEGLVEDSLLVFFTADKNENIYNVLHFHLFTQRGFTTQMKIDLLIAAAKSVMKDKYDLIASPYFQLIDRFVRLRNIAAHYMGASESRIAFIKRKAKFTHLKNDKTKEVDPFPSLTGEYKTIEIGDAQSRDTIEFQFQIIFDFLFYLMDAIAGIEFKEYEIPPYKDLKSEIDPLRKGGIWDVPLPK